MRYSCTCGFCQSEYWICVAGVDTARHRHGLQTVLDALAISNRGEPCFEVCGPQACCISIRNRPRHLLESSDQGVRAIFDAGTKPLPETGLVARKRILSTNHQSVQAFRLLHAETETDPSAHRVAPKVCLLDAKCVEHSGHVRYPQIERVVRRIVRLVTLAMTPCVDQDRLVAVTKRGDVAIFPPGRKRVCEAVLQHKRLPAAFNRVVYPNASITSIRHLHPPPFYWWNRRHKSLRPGAPH